MAVTLYADNEANDIRKIEQGVGQGFKFERGAVPSAEQVMSLAGTVAREQIKGVSEEMVGFFKESAQELLAEETSQACWVGFGLASACFFLLLFVCIVLVIWRCVASICSSVGLLRVELVRFARGGLCWPRVDRTTPRGTSLFSFARCISVPSRADACGDGKSSRRAEGNILRCIVIHYYSITALVLDRSLVSKHLI